MAMLLPNTCALAEDLPDPTRPPASVMAPSASPVAEPAKPVGLQSVIISKKRSAAIIDGQTIELGGKYGDVRLIEVSDTGVILQGARGKRTMTLFPGVSISKKVVRSEP
ncbi:MAG TPA: hypothetical protein VFF26_13365 [Gallionella sp.]|nr:hypothetical protein [Gallionella sp.]